jgi:hypothetical protein
MELNSDKQLEDANKIPVQISKKWRVVSVFGIWVITLLVLAIDIFLYQKMLGLIYCPVGILLFPTGILSLLPLPEPEFPNFVYGCFLLGLGWSVFIGLTIGSFLCKSRLWFYIIFSILLGLLVFNGVGCHKMIKEPFHMNCEREVISKNI